MGNFNHDRVNPDRIFRLGVATRAVEITTDLNPAPVPVFFRAFFYDNPARLNPEFTSAVQDFKHYLERLWQFHCR